jgi:hypothetical protein
VSGSSSGATDASGSALLKSNKFKRGTTETFTVTGVALGGFVYAAAQNTVTSVTIPIAQ